MGLYTCQQVREERQPFHDVGPGEEVYYIMFCSFYYFIFLSRRVKYKHLKGKFGAVWPLVDTFVRIGLLPHSLRAQRHRLSEGPIQRRLQYNMLCSSCMIFAAVVLIRKLWTDWVTFWQESVLEMPLHQQPKNLVFGSLPHCFGYEGEHSADHPPSQSWQHPLTCQVTFTFHPPMYLSGTFHFHFPPCCLSGTFHFHFHPPACQVTFTFHPPACQVPFTTVHLGDEGQFRFLTIFFISLIIKMLS